MITKTKTSKLLQVHVEATDYNIRIEEVRGTTYWVVPVVMMVEGVHHGSRGPLLYTEEELAASVSAWNGMPVTIGHPQDEEGSYISANLPGVLDGIVGRIYNTRMQGSKLTAEAWIDVNSLTELSSDAFEYIKEKKALDVSVGCFSEEVRERGEFNGEEYRGEATNIRPDHLALLPGEVGACSWDDGCGIRTNSKNKMKTNKAKGDKTDKTSWIASLIEARQELISNDASFGDLMRSAQEILNSMDNDQRVYYLEEVYDDYIVYCSVNRQSGERSLYKQGYSVSQDNKVALQGDPAKVRREVSYISMTRTNFNNKQKPKMKTNSKCTCTVDSLIQNEATHFTEDDREWLSELPQEQLNKLAPKVQKAAEPVSNKGKEEATPKEEKSLVSKNEDGSISINGKSIDQHIKEAFAKESDPMKFIDNVMPDGLKDQMKSGLKMYQNRRAAMVKDIAANSKFKEEQLKSWSDEDLQALHESVVPEKEEQGGNYAAFAGGSLEEGEESETSEEEINAMLSFSAPKEKPAEKKK